MPSWTSVGPEYITDISSCGSVIVLVIIIIIIILFVQKPQMQQCKTKDMDVEQDTPGLDKLLRWLLNKEYGNTQIHKM